jgi:hypothetical protein
MAPWLKVQLARFIISKIKEKRMFKKYLKEGGIAALVVGLVSMTTGVDVAPEDVDKLMTAFAVLAVYGPRIYDGLKARFSKKVAE